MDIYKEMASKIHKVPIDDVTEELRQDVKSRFYLLSYVPKRIGFLSQVSDEFFNEEVIDIFNEKFKEYKRNI